MEPDHHSDHWVRLGRAVVDSPRQRRVGRLSSSAVAAAFCRRIDVEELLVGSGRREWMSLAAECFATRLALRRAPCRVGGHQFPPAREVDGLLETAVAEIRSEAALTRTGLAGLAVLMVHPYIDGNGRSARFIWLKGMLDEGIPPMDAVGRLDEFYGPGGVAALPTFKAASNGAIGPFLTRWAEVMSDSPSGRYGPGMSLGRWQEPRRAP